MRPGRLRAHTGPAVRAPIDLAHTRFAVARHHLNDASIENVHQCLGVLDACTRALALPCECLFTLPSEKLTCVAVVHRLYNAIKQSAQQ